MCLQIPNAPRATTSIQMSEYQYQHELIPCGADPWKFHASYAQAENVNVTHFVTEFCEDDITYV